jgi:hypothetical protein
MGRPIRPAPIKPTRIVTPGTMRRLMVDNDELVSEDGDHIINLLS